MPSLPIPSPCDLRCEYVINPLGLDVARPRLGWRLPPDEARRGLAQSAYQIRVAATPEALRDGGELLWDSGKIEGDQAAQIPFGGTPLTSRQRAWWAARVWTSLDNEPTAYSAPAWWEMGLLESADWDAAQWVGAYFLGGPRTGTYAPYLRRDFDLGGGRVASARLYATALGAYEFYLNGQRVGEDVFAPGWTDYAKRVQYQTYDVTTLLREGANAAGAILGDGWYCGHISSTNRQTYGDRPRLLAVLAITYADGSTRTITTDGEWRVTTGPILEADFVHGESYDARLEMPDWCEPGISPAGHWGPVEIFADPGVRRVAQRGPTVRKMGTVVPTKAPVRSTSWEWGWSGWIVDLGQNMVGHARLKLRAPRGTTFRLRFAEILDPKGNLYTTNLRSARATDYYTCRGGGEEEIWEPRFTFHGFRYVEVSNQGPWYELPADAVTGVVVHSNIPPTGEFECSEPLVNQLQHNIQWGQKGNFLDVPTDCPQRDERLGWMGDAQVFVRTAAFNAQVAGFFTKWQDDLVDAQAPEGAVPCIVPNPPSHITGADKGSPGYDGGPAWADAVVICPWTIYLCYGDTRLLETHYDSLARYVGYMEATSRDGTRCFPAATYFKGFGDWLALDGSGKTEGGTPTHLLGTAFLAHSARLLGRIAHVLGKEADARRYEELSETAKAAFQREFVTPSGRVASSLQTAYVLALHFDLLPEGLRAAAAEELVADIRARGNHLATGFVGTPYLPHVLTAAGKLDVAYELLHQKTWPSWLYAVTQGATTIWERWNGWTHDQGFADPGMNSYNHYAYGAVGDWLYATVAGIDLDPERPAYKHIVMRPRPGGGLTRARAALETAQGRVASAWTLGADGAFDWRITVPPNATATAYVPARFGATITEGGGPVADAAGVEFVGGEEGAAVYRLGAGDYHFAVN